MLCQTFWRASRRKRLEASRFSGVSSRSRRVAPPGRGQLVVLGRDPRCKDIVDAFMVTAAPAHQHLIAEVVVTDDGQQGLGQVVVHMGVDAEQDMAQWGKVR